MKKNILVLTMLFSMMVFSQSNEKPFVAVFGESSIKVMPDYAIVKIRVEAIAKTAAEAKKKHDLSVDAVLKMLKKMKFDSKEIATQYMNLNRNFDYSTKEYQFVATQSIHITLKDFNKYEALMQGLFESGVSHIDDVQFASTDIEIYKAQARKLAVQNAKQKAIEYAGVINQSVGKALVISEFQQSIAPMYETKMALQEVIISNPRETIAVGELMVTAKLNITFELK